MLNWDDPLAPSVSNGKQPPKPLVVNSFFDSPTVEVDKSEFSAETQVIVESSIAQPQKTSETLTGVAASNPSDQEVAAT